MSDPIGRLVKAVVDGTLADDELIEWLRNVFENGLDSESTIRLTEAISCVIVIALAPIVFTAVIIN